MAFFRIDGRLLEKQSGRSTQQFAAYKRMEFGTSEGWVTVRPVSVPAALDESVEVGREGSFFFLRAFGRSLLFATSISGTEGAMAAQAISRLKMLRFLLGSALGIAGIFLYPEPRLGAFACALMLLGCYNLACGLVYTEARASAFVHGGIRPAQPGSSLQGS